MKEWAKARSIAVLVWLTLAATSHAQDSLGRIIVGAPFPDVELPLLADGKRTSINEYRGKPTVLIIFASW